jgi:hypothetical protein
MVEQRDRKPLIKHIIEYPLNSNCQDSQQGSSSVKEEVQEHYPFTKLYPLSEVEEKQAVVIHKPLKMPDMCQ